MSVDIQNIIAIDAPSKLNHKDNLAFLKLVQQAIDSGDKRIDIDCFCLKHMTSSHVGLIWKAFLLCKKNNVEMILSNVSKPIYKVFRLLDLDNILTIEEDKNNQNDAYETAEINIPVSHKFEKEFFPTTEEIRDIKLQINLYLNEQHFDEQFIYEVETVFYEVLTNIRLHAKTNESDKVKFSLSYNRYNIYMECIDFGIPFDPKKNKKDYDPSKSIQVKQKNGFGIYMIHKMTNEIDYERKDNANILKLKKIWGGKNA